MEEKKLTNKELINLAWNATDHQDQALLKLEYFLMAHYAYLLNTFEDMGDDKQSNAEVSGFYAMSTNLIEEIKNSSETIYKGFRAYSQ